MAYTNSSLVELTRLSPNHSGQRTHAIDRITPHCVVGQCSVETLGSIFAPTSKQASCNYGIGADGRVGMYVEEKNRSWCSSSNANDQRAVTIECASDTTEPYAFRDVVYQKLITLCVDICRRNGKKKLIWFGDKEKTLNYSPKGDEMILTVHRWFANKSCPGNWMYARMGDLAAKVTAQLGGSTEQKTETEIKSVGLQATALKGLSEADAVKKVGALFTADQKKSGILASVSLAQFILESGYGSTELAQNANNCFGMKKSLSGNTWSGSTWDGKSIYTKKTQEDDGTGRLYTITADFRKYPCVEDSIADHSAYLLGAMNGNKLRYAGLKGCTDYKKAVQIIKDGGYATSTTYVAKLCNIIERWDLTQYDVKTESIPATKPIAERTIHDITKENLSQVPRSRGSNKIEFIVVHYLGVPNADNPNLYGGGYGGHYNIKRDGTIYKAADPKTAVVWHCGGGLQGSGGHSFYKICTNFNSIGIECGVCYTENVKEASGDSDKWYFTTETQESLVWLVSKLMDEYGISADHVIRHYDVTGKICPNPYVKNNRLRTSWTWDEFKSRLVEYRKTGGYDSDTPAEVKWYRVRKNWSDAASQKGAFKILDNAKACADENPGYSVFDSDGVKVYASKAEEEAPDVPFLVRVSIPDLNIRKGPGTNFSRTGSYTGKGVFTHHCGHFLRPGLDLRLGQAQIRSGLDLARLYLSYLMFLMPVGCPPGWSAGSFFYGQKVLPGIIKIGSMQAWDGRGMDKFPRKGEREYASNKDHIACRDQSACRSPAYG